MGISKMKLVSIVGRPDDIESCADVLASSGVYQADDVTEFFSASNAKDLIPITSRSDVGTIVEKMKTIITETGIEVEYLDPKEYSDADLNAVGKFIEYAEHDILSLIERKKALEVDMSACKHNIETASHFSNLSVDVERLVNCEYVRSHFGRLSKESYQKLERYKNNPFIKFIPTSNDRSYYWGIYIVPIDNSDEVDRIFSALYFEEIDISSMKGTPERYIENEESKMDSLKNEYEKTKDDINLWSSKHKDEFLKVYSRLCELYGHQLILNRTYRYKDSFIMIGWIPSEYQGKISTQLSSISSLDVTFTDGRDEMKHSPPVRLKNRFFSRPFEFYTEMYGLPRYNETDPSTFIAITYTILFGIMFADVGHGIILSLIAMYMYFKMKMPLGRLLIPCGISSAIFGLFFGSVFGYENLLDPMYKSLFNLDEKPIEVLRSSSITLIIFSAIGIGIMLMIIAMILNVYSSIKRRDIANALFGANGLAGLVFYSALALGLASNILLGVNVFNVTYVIILIVIPIILVFMKSALERIINQESRIFPDGVGSYIMDNFFELFETVLSYLTNTMSFLRVGAFVLVHAGMMLVVFAIAEMFSMPGYIITMVIGNAIVIALEALLVGIQVLRLEYYEMFSKFYIGDGRKFEPVNTKNINL